MKKFNFKKAISIFMVFLYIFTITPAAMAEEPATVSRATAYNVHITGNFVVGETLTAEYTYYHPDGIDENEDAVTYTWYCFKTKESATPIALATSKSLTITEDMLGATNNWAKNFFVAVQTSSVEDDNVLGEPVYSRHYGKAIPANATPASTAPSADNAYIMPINPSSTTNVGDTVGSYFTYQEANKVEEGSHLYEWKTKTSLDDASPVIVQATGTTSTYVIKEADLGKYLECTITPVAADGTKGTAITTRNHLNNLFMTSNVKVTFAQNTESSDTYGDGAYWGRDTYPASLILSDGVKSNGILYYGSMLYRNKASLADEIEFDLGEVKLVDGCYYNLTRPNDTTEGTISYRKTLSDEWEIFDTFSLSKNATLNSEAILPSAVEARYFKFDFTTGGLDSRLHEFYPILTSASFPKIDLFGDATIRIMQGAAYEESGFIATTNNGETDLSNLVETVIENSQGQVIDSIDTDKVGEYTITYKLQCEGYPIITAVRKVIVDTGIQTDGDLAYKCEVESENGINGEYLVDGNENTYWSAGSNTDSVVIDLKEKMAISRFVILENGSDISKYELLVSDDKNIWSSVHNGEALSGNVIDISPVEARYIKLKILEASAPAKIKTFEIHLTDDAKLAMATDAVDINADLNNVTGNLELPVTGLFNTTITWKTEEGKEGILSDKGVVVQQPLDVTVKLTATITYTAENQTVLTDTKEFSVIVKAISLPKALDVYITGNMVVGQELTCHYTYYDASCNAEDTDAVEYQWYRMNNLANHDAGKIPGATSKTYTITEMDKDYYIYASVTPKSTKNTGNPGFSGVLPYPATESVVDTPAISNQYISSLSPMQTITVGDTLRVHYAYTERGGTPEGKTTYIWLTRDSLGGDAKIVQAESSKDTYTVTSDDFGKWIECIITPVSEDGTKGDSVTAKNHYGNGFMYDFATTYKDNSKVYSYPGVNSGKIYSHESAGKIYSSNSVENLCYSMDAGKAIDFDAIYLLAQYAANTIKIEYSIDGENYIQIPLADKYTALAKSQGKEIILDKVIKARYIKLYLTKENESYFVINAFFPYITTNAGPTITLHSPEKRTVLLYDEFIDDTYTALDCYGENANDAVNITGSVNTNLPGNYDIVYTISQDGYPTATAKQTFNVVRGIAKSGDIAYNKNVKVSSIGSVTTLTDGNDNTECEINTNDDIVIDLGKVEDFSEIVIGESTTNIQNVSVYASCDNNLWNTVVEGVALTDGKIKLGNVKAQYLKISVVSSAKTRIHSIEVFIDDAAKVKLAAEALELSGNLFNVTEDLALPKKGLYDVNIKWSSDNSAISSEGAITRGGQDVKVVLTATIFNDALSLTKEFTVIVKRYAGNNFGPGSGSGGGAGSGSGSGSIGGVSLNKDNNTDITYLPPNITNNDATQSKETYKVFTDVPDSHWAAEYINKLYDEKIVSGMDKNTYAPDANVTRAEFLKLLIEALGLQNERAGNHIYNDVASDSWYAKYVSIASQLGIAKGTGDGNFSPNAPILRRDMAVLAYRAIKVANKTLDKVAEKTLIDNDNIAEYARESVKALSDAGIINGTEKGEFLPDNNANRAESAKIIYLIKEQVKIN